MNLIRPAALATSCLLALSGCNSVATLAGYDTATLNQAAAQSYTQSMSQARQQGKIDTSSTTSKRIRAVFNRLKPQAEAANTTGIPFNWQLNVIRSDEMNAWALPGGKMAVYTGLVDKLNMSNEEIAFVIGHEMTHALEEHARAKMGSQVLSGVALGIGGSILQAKTGIGSETLGVVQSLTQTFAIDQPYSRSNEYAADRGGLILMARAGYDPAKALGVWDKMNRYNDNNNVISGFLSTHPTNNARTQAMRSVYENEARAIYQQKR